MLEQATRWKNHWQCDLEKYHSKIQLQFSACVKYLVRVVCDYECGYVWVYVCDMYEWMYEMECMYARVAWAKSLRLILA